MKGWILATFLAALFATSSGITSETVSAIKEDMREWLNSNSRYIGRGLRLSFHDCVSFACDGCVNLSQAANVGLDEVIEELENEIIVNYQDEMSRADFWALAGIVALEVGATNGGTNLPEIVFKSGRVDCAVSQDDDQEFEYPNGAMDHDSMFAYMESHFGYNANQTTALMGAHALGNMHFKFSSYAGTFTTGAHKELNNQYFSDMFEMTWIEETFKKSELFQYYGVDSDGQDIGARLFTDMELLYQITLDEDGSSSCTLEECGHSDTYDLSYEYANDNDKWASDFATVFQDLIDRGYAADELVIPE